MKNKMKDNSGFALVGVLVLLMVLSLMGTAMYSYSISSLRSVRFSSEAKKAEYLAKAGVEAAAYAYQSAINQADGTGTAKQKALSAFIDDMGENGQTAESSPVYLAWNKTAKEYQFLSDKPTDTELYDYVGYYTVVMETVQLEYTNPYADANATKEERTIMGHAKQFQAVGHSGKNNAVASAKGYIPDPSIGSSMGYYNEKGIIQYPSGANNSNPDTVEPYSKVGSTETIEIKRAYTTRFFRWLTGNETFNIGSIQYTPYVAAAAGNMILSHPKDENSDTIRFPQSRAEANGGADSGFFRQRTNSVAFASREGVFVQANLDTTPTYGNFNAVYLVGKDIVINGNIEMYAYCIPTNANQTLIWSIFNTLSGGFGVGKVIVGVPTETSESGGGNVPTAPYSGKVLSEANFDTAGKIYFGGNVTVTIEVANEGKHRYRAFKAGDVYYYDAEAKVVTSNGMQETSQAGSKNVYGVDLLQYFLEKSIVDSENATGDNTKFVYGAKTVQRFKKILEFYYKDYSGSESGTYSPTLYTGSSSSDINAMYVVPTDEVSRYTELVPPDPFGASTLVWTAR